MVTMLTNLLYLRRSKISYQYKQIQQMLLIYICDILYLLSFQSKNLSTKSQFLRPNYQFSRYKK